MFSTSGWTYLSKIGEYNKREGEVIGSYLSFAKLGDFISTLASGFIVTWLGIPSLFIIYLLILPFIISLSLLFAMPLIFYLIRGRTVTGLVLPIRTLMVRASHGSWISMMAPAWI